MWPTQADFTPEQMAAAVIEGMCPYGHTLEPYTLMERTGICHTCRPCIRYTIDVLPTHGCRAHVTWARFICTDWI